MDVSSEMAAKTMATHPIPLSREAELIGAREGMSLTGGFTTATRSQLGSY